METSIYTKEGKAKGKITLPEEVFGLKWNSDLVHQVVNSLMTAKRMGTAHTKDRGEVSGGGKKPWAQKGTGRARHGSSRSPIWVGGGVAHGPRNDKNFDRKINKKVKAKSIAVILSQKYRDGEIIFMDSFGFSAPKTKDAVAVMSNIASVKGFEKVATKRTNALLVATSSKDKNTEKSFGNISKSFVSEVRNLNPIDLMKYKYLVIENPEVSVGLIKERLVK
ncbi:MAG: ribosomal protein large subunit ribosomal protein [Candidatus Taylorbacteria bacterium]|nr:ribosomal protein large subunit ribosomal protein [Candidatus Taylorbacteria bacterium]